MSWIRPVGVVLVLVVVLGLLGCGGSSDNLVYQNISERAAWSTANYLAFTAYGGNGQKYIYRCNQSGTAQVLLTKTANDVKVSDEGGWHPAFSPDADKVAFSGRRSGGTTSLYLMDALDGDRNTTAFKRLTDSSLAGQDIQPNWRPDGTKIVFASDKVTSGGTGGLDIAVMNADGTGREWLVTNTDPDQWPCYNPDGTKIVYQSGPVGGKTDLHILDLATTADTNLTAALRNGASDDTRFEAPTWAKIGTQEWIYFHSNRDGDFDLFRIKPDGTSFTQITKDPRSDGYPVVNPTGTKVLFTRDRELWSCDPTGVNEKRLTRRY